MSQRRGVLHRRLATRHAGGARGAAVRGALHPPPAAAAVLPLLPPLTVLAVPVCASSHPAAISVCSTRRQTSCSSDWIMQERRRCCTCCAMTRSNRDSGESAQLRRAVGYASLHCRSCHSRVCVVMPGLPFSSLSDHRPRADAASSERGAGHRKRAVRPRRKHAHAQRSGSLSEQRSRCSVDAQLRSLLAELLIVCPSFQLQHARPRRSRRRSSPVASVFCRCGRHRVPRRHDGSQALH